MFRASSCPSSEATTTAVAVSGLPSELGDSSAVGRGRAARLMMHGLANPKSVTSVYCVAICACRTDLCSI
jgi:hypothetical protein